MYKIWHPKRLKYNIMMFLIQRGLWWNPCGICHKMSRRLMHIRYGDMVYHGCARCERKSVEQWAKVIKAKRSIDGR